MRGARASAGVVAALFLVACGAHPEAQPAPAPGGHAAAAPRNDPIALLFSQFAEANDYRRFAAAAPSLGRWERGVPRPTEGAFLFLRGFETWDRFPLTTGMETRGLVFEKDGSMAPSVVLPAHEIAAGDRAALASLLSTKGTTEYGPIWRAHHVFVIFSAEGMRQVAVDLAKGWWDGDGIEGNRPDKAALEQLRAICRRAGAPLCDFGSEAAEQVFERWRAEELERTFDRGHRRKSRPLPLDAGKTVAALSKRERRLACLWNIEHLNTPPGRWVGHVDGFWALPQTWKRCVDRFPKCDVAVKDVEPCMEVAQKGDIWLVHTELGRRCAARRACMWGFEWATGAEPHDSGSSGF